MWANPDGSHTTELSTGREWFKTVACRHRIQIDYTPSPTATLALQWAPGATGAFGVVPGDVLAPRYGLVTRTVVDDATAGSPPVVTATAYGGTDNPDPA